MQICRINPLSDPRWQRFVESHRAAAIFHTRAWLEALHRTYGYEPVVYAGVGADQELVSGIPFCRIRSFVTGRRLVSLPFSDHCQPLVENAGQLADLVAAAENDIKRDGFKYVELRPLELDQPYIEAVNLAESSEAVLHRLNLARSQQVIVDGFHKSCVLRKIRNTCTGLVYEAGRSESLLARFYRLLLLTRRKHQLPPQPLVWFRNLISSLGDALTIRLVSKDGLPIASVLTLSFKKIVTYKYSCSDPRFNSMAGTVHLIWDIIQESMTMGATELDLGKSDLDTPGLIQFKDHWGAVRSRLLYYRYPSPARRVSRHPAMVSAAQRLLTAIPDSMFTAVGGLLYRHVG
jgi:hypothetical protein